MLFFRVAGRLSGSVRWSRWPWIGLSLSVMHCGSVDRAGSGEMGDLSAADVSVGGISEVPNPTAAMAAASGRSLQTLQRGHVVYMLKCAECHAYMLPQDLYVDEWREAVPEMIAHAGLDPSDEQAVLAYVLAVKGT